MHLTALEELLAAPTDDGGPSRIAWLRQAPGSAAARNLVGLIERVQTVRALGLNRDREAAAPPAAFDTLAGEGLRMTAQHLRGIRSRVRGVDENEPTFKVRLTVIARWNPNRDVHP